MLNTGEQLSAADVSYSPSLSPEVVEALRRPIAIAVRGIVGADSASADDAIQLTWEALIVALPAFRGDSSLSTFAYRIATRTALHMRRSERRRVEVGAEFHQRSGAQLSSSQTPELHVRELVDSLPLEQAEALMLRTILGFSIPEIASLTEAPANTVKSRLRLAKAALSARLADQT